MPKLATYLRPAKLPEHHDPMYAGLEDYSKYREPGRIEKFMLSIAEGDDGLSIEIKARGHKAILHDLAGITLFCGAFILGAVYSHEIYLFFGVFYDFN